MREPTDIAAMPYQQRLLLRLVLMVVTVALLMVTGPFGTFADLTPVQRLGYWSVTVGAGFAAFEILSHFAAAFAERRCLPWPPVVAGLMVVVTLLLTVAVAATEKAARGLDFFSVGGFAELFLYVAALTMVVAALPLWIELRARGLVGRAPPSPGGPAEAEQAPAREPVGREPPFLARIPPHLGRDLAALHTEDHYVRVRTARGSDLVLMRMRDAVAELEAYPGLQVHRSHWVATAAVRKAERSRDGRITLVLNDGTRVPVSRTYAREVRAAGW